MTRFITLLAAILLVNHAACAEDLAFGWWGKATPEQVEEMIKSGKINVNKPDSLGVLPIANAATECASPEVLDVLIKNGADVNAEPQSDSPEAMIASYPILKASNCPLGVVQKLVEAGADIDVAYAEGESLLAGYASSTQYPEVVKYLMENGAHYQDLDINGNNVLMMALYNENPVPIINALVENGVDINMTGNDYTGKKITVLDFAESEGKAPDILNYLRSKGAKHASEL